MDVFSFTTGWNRSIERLNTAKEQRALFLFRQKDRKREIYEGVLLSATDKIISQYPTKLYLAMAAIRQEEKHQRKTLMKELNKTELEVISVSSHILMK